jgi:hypothetical protein
VKADPIRNFMDTVPDNSGQPLPGHAFQKVYFTTPTWCSFCKDFVWGVHKKQGYKCSYCSGAAHSKCRFISPTCPKAKPGPTGSLNARNTSVETQSSSPPTKDIKRDTNNTEPQKKVSGGQAKKGPYTTAKVNSILNSFCAGTMTPSEVWTEATRNCSDLGDDNPCEFFVQLTWDWVMSVSMDNCKWKPEHFVACLKEGPGYSTDLQCECGSLDQGKFLNFLQLVKDHKGEKNLCTTVTTHLTNYYNTLFWKTPTQVDPSIWPSFAAHLTKEPYEEAEKRLPGVPLSQHDIFYTVAFGTEYGILRGGDCRPWFVMKGSAELLGTNQFYEKVRIKSLTPLVFVNTFGARDGGSGVRELSESGWVSKEFKKTE